MSLEAIVALLIFGFGMITGAFAFLLKFALSAQVQSMTTLISQAKEVATAARDAATSVAAQMQDLPNQYVHVRNFNEKVAYATASRFQSLEDKVGDVQSDSSRALATLAAIAQRMEVPAVMGSHL